MSTVVDRPAPAPESALSIPVAELEQMKGLAGLLPGDPAELFAKMMFGRGLGMGPAQSLAQIDWIKGKAEMSANAQAARMKSYVGPWGERYDYEVVELSNEECILRFVRRWPNRPDDVEFLGDSAFTMEDAKTAGLAGGMYDKFPRNMLISRAMSNGVAWFAPETTYGQRVYSLGELNPSRDHAVPALPDGVPDEQPPAATVAPPQREALPSPAPDPSADEGPVAPPAVEQAPGPRTPLGGEASATPTEGRPTDGDFAELRRRYKEKGLTPEALSEIADQAHVPAGESLRDRFSAANRGQIVSMIAKVAFYNETPPAGDGEQQTIDGSVADDPAPTPAEGVMGASS
jgi:hypothetical protein